MREEIFRKFELKQTGVSLSDEVYSESLAAVTVDVYFDKSSRRMYQLDKKLRRYRMAEEKAGAPFGPWKPLD